MKRYRKEFQSSFEGACCSHACCVKLEGIALLPSKGLEIETENKMSQIECA